VIRAAFVMAVLALAACGVDGAPVPPAAKTTPPPGLSISGEARVGVVSRL
jgi:predicted small lipoprotein YifL